MASNAAKQEFSRLELGKAPFDLSDRGIDGRDQPGPVDAFLYTERGIYRPGETVQLMAMLRDASAVALANMPVTLIVKRPDGSEFTRFSQALPAGGALHQPIALPKSSRRGRWSVAAHVDPKAPPVGSVEFSVEDFVPEKLKVELSLQPADPASRPGQQLRHPGRLPLRRAGQRAHGRGRPAHHRRCAALPRFRQLQLRPGGGAQEVRAAVHHAQGAGHRRRGQVAPRMGRRHQGHAVAVARPVQARVFEPGGGRATKTEKTLPMRTRDAYLGIRPTFEGRYSREGAETEFDIVAVDADGKQVARPGVEYQIERTDYTYQWYQVDGRWRWQSIANDAADHGRHRGAQGRRADAAEVQAELGPASPHRHRPPGQHDQHDAFYVGWYGGSDSGEETPDTLRVASDKENYAPGETARCASRRRSPARRCWPSPPTASSAPGT